MDTIASLKQHFELLQSAGTDHDLAGIRESAFHAFSRMGIPTTKHEEWKYTRISPLFNKSYQFPSGTATSLNSAELDAYRLPGHAEANEVVFINGLFSPVLSRIRSASALTILPLAEAASNGYRQVVLEHLGDSGRYLKDGINALNTAFVQGGVFIDVKKGQSPGHPVYFYHITDAREVNIFSQPRSLVYVQENAQLQMVETYVTIGDSESFTNQVMEVVMEKGALVEYYKIQNDRVDANLVSTTHFRQIGKSYLHAATVSLNGGIIRNNLNVILEADNCEAHLYGLYFQRGKSHIDNHTVVDNVRPSCFSNELYKGILDDEASGVFNGKIFVRQQAQKTNAYQSNKNILLSDNATINSKPQLEIFADDVKCSHGCTVGQLDEEALFYLQSRGIRESIARSLLVRAFAGDILEHIKPTAIRIFIEQLISERLIDEVA